MLQEKACSSRNRDEPSKTPSVVILTVQPGRTVQRSWRATAGLASPSRVHFSVVKNTL